MMRSDLLLEDEITRQVKVLDELSEFIVLATTHSLEKNDPDALTHLYEIMSLKDQLKNLKGNLPYITIDIEELSKARAY